MPKCIYCDTDFIIKPTGLPGGQNRQLCYDCLPEGCSKQEFRDAAKYYLRKRAAEEKLQRGCDICGYNKSSWALEWHHDKDDKNFNPSYLLTKGNRDGLNLYYKEIEKCQLLCCNCHREIHEQQRKTVFNKPKGNNKYHIYRESVKNFYLQCKNLNKTAQYFEKDISAIRTVLNYYNIPIENNIQKVAMLDKQTEEILKVYSSITEAALELKKNPKGSHIGDVCRGKRKTACGYKWKFID